ncbi:MAG: AFG1/ZapE family ATPase, partial [Burkholderiales bacterium]
MQPSPQESYRQKLTQGIITPDASQEAAIDALQRVYADLQSKWRRKSGWQRLAQRLHLVKPQAVQGLYLWGGVGRGKTFLMDLFFHSLPGERKLRMHFH